MAPDDPNEPSFLEEMARLGVKPLEGDRARPPGADKKARAGAAKKVQPVADRARPGVGAEKPAAAKPAAEKPPAAKPAPPAARPPQVGELERDLADARRALARAEEARQALETERRSWQSEQDRLRAKNSELRRQLERAEKAATQRTAVMDVLMARGLADEDEALIVLRDLLETRPGELLAALELADAGPLARVLEQRVALVAHDLDVDMGPESVIVRVTPERCEITGGSDIQAGFRRFLEACRRAGASQVTIVGGSPAYRRELKRLAGPHHRELKLNLVSGTKRREKKRAEADMRTSDLVVIWGSTELDHSVSAVYTRSASNKPLIVHHRGISRMLSQVAEHLDRR